MDRRDFLKQVAAWTAGVALAKPLVTVPAAMAAEAAGPTTADAAAMAGYTGTAKVTVAKGKDYAALVKQVLAPLGGMEEFVRKGDKVVVKPNIGWDRNVDQAANTHPEVVAATVKAALDAGASQVLVFDRTCNNPLKCYANSGIEAAVKAVGDDRVRCEQIDSRKFVPVQIQGAHSLAEWQFYKDALETDCYINVPIAKHHSGARLTLGLKNAMGVIGGTRGEIHKGLGQRIAELNLVIRPKLTIIDATRILLRHGPAGGNLEDVKVLDTLIASADTVAADAYATTLFDLRPEQIESTVAAFKLGLGQMKLDKIEVVNA